jgi:hypothetical protein
MILALGAGLLLAGATVYRRSANVAMPAVLGPTTQPAKMFNGPNGGFRPPPMDDQGPPDQFAPPDGPRGQMGPPGGRRFGPAQRGPLVNDEPPGPPRGGGNPAMEYWHRAQDEKAVASVAMGSGLVLALLGIVRVMFAYAERRYAGDARGIA